MSGLRIASVGKYLPPTVLGNHELAAKLQVSEEWILSRTGIVSRHLATDDTVVSMAAKAGREALVVGGISPEEIGVVIVATSTPDSLSPAAACLVQRELGLPEDVIAFDLSCGCAGFLTALQTAQGLLTTMPEAVATDAAISATCDPATAHGFTAMPRKKALVIASERCSTYLNWSDRSTCILFGDGAGAAVVELEEATAGISPTETASATAGQPDPGSEPLFHLVGGTCGNAEMLGITADGSSADSGNDTSSVTNEVYGCEPPAALAGAKEGFPVITMNGAEVFKFAVTKIPQMIDELLRKANLTAQGVDHFVFHQANGRILRYVCEKQGVPEEKVFSDLQKYGNTAAASIPIALADMREQGLLHRGETVLLASYGAGLAWRAALLRW
ncbi:MAG: 3-oxoacyl-ACP synthase III family protein [Eggerthellaceae bacterium]